MLVETAYFSIIVQFITGIIDIYGIKLNVKDEVFKFQDLLKIELSVQVVEFIFYIWLIFNLKKRDNITKFRYFDWFITTPIMLVTLMIYYDKKSKTVKDFLLNNQKEIISIITLNSLMLIFGLLGELKIINYNLGGVLGFVPFVAMFKIIYDKFVQQAENKGIFFYFIIFWSLYGVAYFMEYNLKNSMYNILDLFAKNGFGLFLVYILYQNRIKE
jgi:bacteriorhodopsin